MHFIDHRLRHGSLKWSITFPVVIIDIDDDAAHAGVKVVSGETGVTSFPPREVVGLGVWVNQNLLRVKAVTIPWIVRAIDAVGITHPMAGAFDEHMPDIETAIFLGIEFDHSNRVSIFWAVEQQEGHCRCVCAVKRKVHPRFRD